MGGTWDLLLTRVGHKWQDRNPMIMSCYVRLGLARKLALTLLLALKKKLPYCTLPMEGAAWRGLWAACGSWGQPPGDSKKLKFSVLQQNGNKFCHNISSKLRSSFFPDELGWHCDRSLWHPEPRTLLSRPGFWPHRSYDIRRSLKHSLA